MKRRIAFLLALLVLVGLTSTTGVNAATKDVIIGLSGDIKNFNIAMGFNPSWFPSTTYYSRLVTMDYGPDFKVHPDLAKEWHISEDGLAYTFKLHENVKWHDGQPFTSADVKFTYEAIVENNGMAVAILSHIKSIDTPDDHTVVLHLKEPFAPFLVQLAMYPRAPILPKHLYEGESWDNHPNNLQPVGTGPFKFEKHVPGQYISFVRNDDYFGRKPSIERIIFKVIPDENVAVAQLRSGEIHALNNPPPLHLEKALDADPNIQVDAPPGPMIYFLSFNVTRAPFDNAQVRTALAYAINRDELNEKITGGIFKAAAGTYLQSVGWAFNDQAKLPSYDPKKAEELLDAAGFPVKDGTRFGLDLWVSRATEINTAQVIREQLRQIGVDVKITQLEDGVFRNELKARKHDAYLYGNWWGPDPSEWEQYTATRGTWNEMGYSNPQVDELFKKGLATLDQNQRAAYYKEIQAILLADMPRIPLFGSGPYSFAHRTELTGWFSDAPASYRMDMTRVKWVEEGAAPQNQDSGNQTDTQAPSQTTAESAGGSNTLWFWIGGLVLLVGGLAATRRRKAG